jgi:hypothetical protein
MNIICNGEALIIWIHARMEPLSWRNMHLICYFFQSVPFMSTSSMGPINSSFVWPKGPLTFQPLEEIATPFWYGQICRFTCPIGEPWLDRCLLCLLVNRARSVRLIWSSSGHYLEFPKTISKERCFGVKYNHPFISSCLPSVREQSTSSRRLSICAHACA